MAERMRQNVIESIKVVVQKFTLSIVISFDEVTTIDNQYWCNDHTYVLDRFK
jgi:hypothetical protein